MHWWPNAMRTIQYAYKASLYHWNAALIEYFIWAHLFTCCNPMGNFYIRLFFFAGWRWTFFWFDPLCTWYTVYSCQCMESHWELLAPISRAFWHRIFRNILFDLDIWCERHEYDFVIPPRFSMYIIAHTVSWIFIKQRCNEATPIDRSI